MTSSSFNAAPKSGSGVPIRALTPSVDTDSILGTFHGARSLALDLTR
jgi:hypothetical protein